MMLIEILNDFFDGKLICREAWEEDRYFFYNKDRAAIMNQNGQISSFYGVHFACSDWKLFEEKKEEREIELLRKKFQVQSESIQIINKENRELNEKISELKNKILKLEMEKRIPEYHQNTSYPTWRELQEHMKPMLHCTLGY